MISVMAINEEEAFFETACLAAYAWKNQIGIEPIICYIGDQVSNINDAVVIPFKPIAGIPTAFQAQCIRLILPCLFPDEVIITTDADMIPLSRDYFEKGLGFVDEDNFVIFRPFDQIREYQKTNLHNYEIPICYNAASGHVWREIFRVTTVNDIRTMLMEWYKDFDNSPYLWSADQRILCKFIKKWDSSSRLLKLSDKVLGFRRLDLSVCSQSSRPNKHGVVFPSSFKKCTDFHLHKRRLLKQERDIINSLLSGFGFDMLLCSDGRMVAQDHISPYATHQTPLITALLNTNGPVLEMGSGDFSTPILHAICKAQKRLLVTADSNHQWLDRFADLQSKNHLFQYVPVFQSDGEHPEAWKEIGNDTKWGLIFVDHSPGSQRTKDIKRLRDSAQVIVIHDTEGESYSYKTTLCHFRYLYTYKRYSTWTTLASNFTDVKLWFQDELSAELSYQLNSSEFLKARFSKLLMIRETLKHIVGTLKHKVSENLKRFSL